MLNLPRLDHSEHPTHALLPLLGKVAYGSTDYQELMERAKPALELEWAP
jgi:hypothetical protein